MLASIAGSCKEDFYTKIINAAGGSLKPPVYWTGNKLF